MLRVRAFLKIIFVSLFLYLLTNFLFYPHQIKAESSQAFQGFSDSEREQIYSINRLTKQSDDADLGRPTSRVSGGGRSPCITTLVALVPGSGTVNPRQECTLLSSSELGGTSIVNPTLWFYVPNYSKPELYAEFVLIDNDSERQIFSPILVQLSEKASIIGIHSPYSLSAGKIYRWSFEILVTNSPTENPTVDGRITLVSAGSYPWHDRLTSLAESLCASPTDINLNTRWSQLLNSEGLVELSDFPIICQ